MSTIVVKLQALDIQFMDRHGDLASGFVIPNKTILQGQHRVQGCR